MTDQYEDETVYVGMSGVEGAGEGLFAKRNIFSGDLVSLFSGTKIYKDCNKKSVKFGDEEWSDFRLTLDKSVDLDVGPEYRLCTQYRLRLSNQKNFSTFSLKGNTWSQGLS